jgi:molybdopterin/thiamine biosynthesis adenylyltransferase
MDTIYQQDRLSVPLDKMRSTRVLLCGAGAVGSHAAASLVSLGVGELTLIDSDTMEDSNFAKCNSGLLYPQDIGRNKAIALAQRSRPRIIHQGKLTAISGSVEELGPAVFEQYDYIISAVDNFKARMHINSCWRQTRTTPALIFCGTAGNYAEAGLLTKPGACLRCTWSEEWVREALEKRASCRMAYQSAEQQGIVPTSSFASCMSALLVCQLILSHISGDQSVENARLHYIARRGAVELGTTHPMKRDCEDCELTPPDPVHPIEGSVMNLTLKQLMEQITDVLDTDDFAFAHMSPFVLEDVCPVCVKGKHVNKPLRRLTLKDVTCVECMGLKQNDTIPLPPPTLLKIQPQSALPAEIAGYTLYQLGFALGAFIPVQVGSVLDGDVTLHYFTCTDDLQFIMQREDIAL